MHRTKRRVYLLALGVAWSVLAVGWLAGVARADGGVSPPMTKWVDPLPVPPVASPRPNSSFKQSDYYEIAMSAHQHRFHSDLSPATVWTYPFFATKRKRGAL